MAGMIYFNSIDIHTVAPVNIEDVHISPVRRDIVARERAIRPGSLFVRARDAARTVDFTLALLTQDKDLRQAQLMALTAWAHSDEPGQLRLPGNEGRHLLALCTGFPEPSTRQWWESRLRFTFTCYDPFWHSDVEKTESCGTAFTVLGNAEPLMWITRTLSEAASSQAYSDGVETMTFSTIPAGDLKIDLNTQTAAVGTDSIMQYYAFGSSFIKPKLGTQTITGSGTVHWRERFI
jgi:phage-related protein